MTKEISNPALQQRLNRIARVLDRADRWQRLAFMDASEADRILMEHNEAKAAMDDGSYPAGPRNDKNKSRYKLAPGHAQNLSDLLRTTAESKAMRKISKLLNG
jgi:hypothetical protein